MKQKTGLTLLTGLAYCIDKELDRAIDYLREQVRVLCEHQGASSIVDAAGRSQADNKSLGR